MSCKKKLHWLFLRLPLGLERELPRPESLGEDTRKAAHKCLIEFTEDSTVIVMRNILILADSRGRKLEAELSIMNDTLINFTTVVKKGAGLDRLWINIEKEMHENNFDAVFIYGGICDLTELKFNERGRRFVDLPVDMESRIVAICDKMETIATKFRSLYPKAFLSFIMEAGLDLIAYNQLTPPISRAWIEKQERLEYHLLSLQDKAKMLNNSMGSQTAWTLDATHAHRGRHMSPVYSRMSDGLHPTEAIAKKLARAIKKATTKMLQHKSVEPQMNTGNHDLSASPR